LSDFEAGLKKRPTAQFIIGTAIVVATLIAIWGVFYLVGNQRIFELHRWQNRLSEASQGAADAAGDWLTERRQVLMKAAANPTVQIYLSELALAGNDQSKIQSGGAKRGFVGSYIAALGQRVPFDQTGGGGIALFSGGETLIASSAGFEPRFDDFRAALKAAQGGAVGATFGNVEGGGEGGAFAYMLMPVTAMQMQMPVPGMGTGDGSGAGKPIGYLVAAFPFGKELGAQMAARGGFSSGIRLMDMGSDKAQVLDVGPDGSRWRVLETGKPDDRELMRIGAEPGQLIDAGGFADGGALVLAAKVPRSAWTVAAYIDRSVALGGVNERLRNLLVTLLFGLFAVIAAVFALWRHGVSVNALKAAHAAEAHAAEIAQRERVLQMVADTYPGELALVDRQDRIAFANARFAGGVGAEASSLVGRALAQSLPKFIGAEALRIIERSRRDEITAHTDDALDVGGRFFALSATPLRGAGWQEGGALLSINDVTDAVQAKEKKARFYWGLVDLLLDAIDQRDPGAAAHSRRVAKLSAEIMRAQEASEAEVETAEIAGALLNVGKLFVPSALLTKSGALDSDERDTILSGSQKWLGLLSRVPFDLPIAEVLGDAQSLMQGRVAAAHVSVIARVIVVANGYVALVSPRTYRQAHSHDEAIDSLAENVVMDGRIVEMLARNAFA
jgi:PAS domain S-box-containing protein